ncbi:MAG: hypothetical protein KAV83_07515 [Desulfobacterales bacterium]|nr:hypothetical protein [Desulfobacterales bacterium]
MRYRLVTLAFLVLLLGNLVCPAGAISPDQEIIERLIKLEEGQKALNQRFDDINGRFDDINGRFDDVNRRIDDLRGLLYVILAGMFALVGFVIWDRRTALSPAIRRTAILEDALKEFSKKEPKMAEILKHLGVM